MALLWFLALAADDALAQAMSEAASAPAVAPVKNETQVNGYVMNRFILSSVALGSPAASQQLPQAQNIMEANVQLRRPLWKDAFFAVDASIFLQQGGWYVWTDPVTGGREVVAGTDNQLLHPRFVPSELYLSYSPHPNVNIMFGRKRIVWGPGLANNPTDVLNPPRDPSDPTLQRAGAYVLRVEVPTERFTFTALASPSVLYTDAGLPYQFLRYPEYAPVDNQLHYLLAGRIYALLFNSDVNLIYYFSNLYNGEAYRNKSRVGLTFSRYFFTDYEFHFDGLLNIGGTQRAYVAASPCDNLPTVGACVAQSGISPSNAFGTPKLNDGKVYPRLLFGARRQFSDESMLGVEYMYVGDGYTPGEFQNAVRGLVAAKTLGVDLASALSTQSSQQNAIIARFSFDPLRRHYLFLTYTKPKIANDWTVSALLLAGLEDLSGVLVPSLTWSAREWLNLQLGGFVPLTFVPLGRAEAFGGHYSEYGLFPYDWRVYLEARVFY